MSFNFKDHGNTMDLGVQKGYSNGIHPIVGDINSPTDHILEEMDGLQFNKESLDKKISSFSWEVLDLMHRLGRFQARPMHYLANRFQRLRYQENTSKWNKVVIFIRMFGIALLSIPTAIFTAPGALLQAVGTKMSNNFGFSPASPKTLESAKISSQSAELKCMQWNVCMGPGFMALDNRVELSTKRVNGIFDQIVSHDPSIVTLQELFDGEATELLVKKLNDAGYDCVHSILSTSPISISSGILLAVKRDSGFKLNLEDIKIWKFKNLAGADSHANKGVLAAKVNVTSQDGKKERVINVFTTHLQASYEEAGYGEVRLEQVSAIADKVNSFTKPKDGRSQSDNQGVIFTGDMNFSYHPLEKSDNRILKSPHTTTTLLHSNEEELKHGNEYRLQLEVLSRAKLFDPNAEAQKSNQGTFLNLKQGKKAKIVPSVVDYIFMSKNLENANLGTKIIGLKTKEVLSDHLPVIQCLSVDKLFSS